MRNYYKILVEKLEGKRPLGRPRNRWENNIRLDLTKIRQSVVDWTHLAQDSAQWWALVDMVTNLRVP
jgi:hypothetical protein